MGPNIVAGRCNDARGKRTCALRVPIIYRQGFRAHYVEVRHHSFSIAEAAAPGVEQHQQQEKKMRCRTCGHGGRDAMDAACSTARVPLMHLFVSPDAISMEEPQTSGIGPVLPTFAFAINVDQHLRRRHRDQQQGGNSPDPPVSRRLLWWAAGRTKQKITQFWRHRQHLACGWGFVDQYLSSRISSPSCFRRPLSPYQLASYSRPFCLFATRSFFRSYSSYSQVQPHNSRPTWFASSTRVRRPVSPAVDPRFCRCWHSQLLCSPSHQHLS